MDADQVTRAMLEKLFLALPNGVVCRELKLLYKSGRLADGFRYKSNKYNEMGLTTFEKMFVKWAIRQWVDQNKREDMKAWATKLAITGKDDDECDPFKIAEEINRQREVRVRGNAEQAWSSSYTAKDAPVGDADK